MKKKNRHQPMPENKEIEEQQARNTGNRIPTWCWYIQLEYNPKILTAISLATQSKHIAMVFFV
jgi:hypothetical protein